MRLRSNQLAPEPMTDKRRRKESVDAKLLALVPNNMQVGLRA